MKIKLHKQISPNRLRLNLVLIDYNFKEFKFSRNNIYNKPCVLIKGYPGGGLQSRVAGSTISPGDSNKNVDIRFSAKQRVSVMIFISYVQSNNKNGKQNNSIIFGILTISLTLPISEGDLC